MTADSLAHLVSEIAFDIGGVLVVWMTIITVAEYYQRLVDGRSSRVAKNETHTLEKMYDAPSFDRNHNNRSN